MANIGKSPNNNSVIPTSLPEEEKPDVFAPDVGPNSRFNIPATIAMEEEEYVPDNFDTLPLSEQKRIINRLKFRGIRLKPIKGIKISLGRETLDL